MELLDWSNLEGEDWQTLLLGNGFSIGVSNMFAYSSLLKQVDDKNIKMYPTARELFENDKVGTVNFEEVLRVINHALMVNFYNIDAITSLYNNVRQSLIEAVVASHVSRDEIAVDQLIPPLTEYDQIFTTNYDLIPHWAMMEVNFKGFCDYFWGNSQEFDRDDTEIWKKKSPIYYLHGAIHLVTDNWGTSYKIPAPPQTPLSKLLATDNKDLIPLFISEGDHKHKLQKIRSNGYLSFCYDELQELTDNLVIYGHGLEYSYDGHIIDAISESNVSKIAISVFHNLSESQKQKYMANIKSLFDENIEIVFFCSDTHPLSSGKNPDF